MKFQIDIPTPIKDAAGNEYEPSGEYREPKEGDWFLHYSEHAAKALCSGSIGMRQIILRPLWTWPVWLGGWGIAMDKSGRILWHESEAALWADRWESTGRRFLLEHFKALLPTFVPPVITDWQTPVLNPNYKEGE